MKPIYVQSLSHKYPIYIGQDLRFDIDQYINNNYSSILIVTDEHVAPLYLNDVKNAITQTNIHEIVIPSGEHSKQLNMFYKIHTYALKMGLDRESAIIALGGGVVGDLAGFVAATFMRGIDYIQIPTTVLAHDSSVGGKVAINHEFGKNLIGSFYPPVSVIYDIKTLQSLPFSEIRSGYAEIIKVAMLADHLMLKNIMNTTLDSLTTEQLYKHLYAGINIKKEIVMKDEKEAHERMYLNLGHTLGHAIESSDDYQSLLHGEAVAIGLLFAIFVSEKHYKINLSLKTLFNWLKLNGFPLPIENLDSEKILTFIKKDKKVIDQQIRLILLKEIGVPTVECFSDKEISTYLNMFLQKIVKWM